MSRFCVIFVYVVVFVSSVGAAEPYSLILTDTEQNIHKQTIQLESGDLTPECPVSWSIHKYVLQSGRLKGADIIDVNNGELNLTIVPSRGMSIQKAQVGDLSLGSDLSENLDGWLTRSGLLFSGSDGTDGIDVTAASKVEIVVERQAPYSLRIRGRIDSAGNNGAKLELWTEISTVPGADTFQMSDKVTNSGDTEQDCNILYHVNYGKPLIDNNGRLFGPVQQVIPVDEQSAPDVSSFLRYQKSDTDAAEQAYGMLFWTDANDRTEVMVHNTSGNMAVSMTYSTKQLPLLTLWKNPDSSNNGYAIGLEPGTVFPRNKAIENKYGEVTSLAPNQSRSFILDFALLTGRDKYNLAAGRISQIWAGRKTQIDSHPPSGVPIKLKDVIKAAKAWGPAFTSWYGKPAPDFAFTDIKGKKHKLSDYHGKNIMIIIWATWCGPCKQEIPHLIELRDTFGEDKLAMFAFSNENPDLVKRFAGRAKMNYTVVADVSNMTSPYVEVNAIPSSFFIDRNGNLKLATMGVLSLRDMKAILEAE